MATAIESVQARIDNLHSICLPCAVLGDHPACPQPQSQLHSSPDSLLGRPGAFSSRRFHTSPSCDAVAVRCPPVAHASMPPRCLANQARAGLAV
eukprot:366056-Chlamydomonas_euryale.AAC.1